MQWGFSFSYFSYFIETYSYYIHIPFCHRVCPYCKFAVSPVVNELTKKRYLEYLKKEITDFFRDELGEMGAQGNSPLSKGDVTEGQGDLVSEKIPPTLLRYNSSLKSGELETFDKGEGNTLYFGGGTPSILSIEELGEILECFAFLDSPPFRGSQRGYDTPPNLPYKGRDEITLESNPEDITEEKVKGWQSLGINRVSLGVQSLDDEVLKAITRSNKETIIDVLRILDRHFENINIDLILGLPYSKPGDTLKAIRELHSQFPNITHTSVYILEDERYPREWKDHYPSEESVQQEYIQICDYLEGKGWHHYEISNWAKPGYESAHNQSYWNHSSYRGFGLSAGSFCNPFEKGGKREAKGGLVSGSTPLIRGAQGGFRLSNASNFRDYFTGKQEQEVLTEEQIRIEKIMFCLRTFSLDESLITNSIKLEQLVTEGLLRKEGKKILPTKTGIFLLDHIIGELI